MDIKNLTQFLDSFHINFYRASELKDSTPSGRPTHIQTNTVFPLWLQPPPLLSSSSFPCNSLVTWYTASFHCYGDSWGCVCWWPAVGHLISPVCLYARSVLCQSWTKINCVMARLETLSVTCSAAETEERQHEVAAGLSRLKGWRERNISVFRVPILDWMCFWTISSQSQCTPEI